jgi:GNAT superfamily N-acetyltransferase
VTDERFEIRLLSKCSFDEALWVWNQGFQGYFVDMTLTLDSFLGRLISEGISPEYSLIALDDDRPVGLLLNGMRTIAGKKTAWNGGTGVIPEFRRQGVGKTLMRAALELYQRENVDVATLEAVAENEKAILLYLQFGYKINDNLIFLQHEGSLSRRFSNNDSPYSIRKVSPYNVGQLSFYREAVPWQAHWQSVNLKHGEALVVVDSSNVEVGYALYKKRCDETGAVNSIALYQCEAHPEREDSRSIVEFALDQAFGPGELECRRSTYNLSKSNQLVMTILEDAGFTTFIEQVEMILTRKEKSR